MKSTLKVVTTPYGDGLRPVIKIVRPTAIIHQSDQSIIDDEDPRDELINQFLKNPSNIDGYGWFNIHTNYPVPFGHDNPTHYVTTIGPVDEKDLFFRFRHAILSKIVPYEDLVAINRGEARSLEQINDEMCPDPITRLDTSVCRAHEINKFFDWLDETGYCSWEEQQPDPIKADRNSAIHESMQMLKAARTESQQ